MATINHDLSLHEIAVELERRRKALGISRQLLAQRSGVSLPTVARILSSSVENSTFANLRSVARALGMDFEIKSTANAQEFAEQQAYTKAKKIARLVQGSSALESQAVDNETYHQIISQTTHELMAGSRRRLWSR